jgi:hypothetical protein
MNQLWLQRRYNELVDLGQDYVIDHPDEIKAKYLLAFGYNAIEDFTSAKYLLENMGLPPPPGTDPVRDGNTDTQYPQFLASYVDALQSLGGNDSLAMDLARYLLSMGHSGDWDVYAKGWWGPRLDMVPAVARQPVFQASRGRTALQGRSRSSREPQAAAA